MGNAEHFAFPEICGWESPSSTRSPWWEKGTWIWGSNVKSWEGRTKCRRRERREREWVYWFWLFFLFFFSRLIKLCLTYRSLLTPRISIRSGNCGVILKESSFPVSHLHTMLVSRERERETFFPLSFHFCPFHHQSPTFTLPFSLLFITSSKFFFPCYHGGKKYYHAKGSRSPLHRLIQKKKVKTWVLELSHFSLLEKVGGRWQFSLRRGGEEEVC